ncbi:hypothetical protein niasHT_020088 [Heterodera trifolii]|uniref:Annexin n=1 Tax=Heterodera trifolii TaxID=157864 RepID=A0ABD2LJK0_9BILA
MMDNFMSPNRSNSIAGVSQQPLPQYYIHGTDTQGGPMSMPGAPFGSLVPTSINSNMEPPQTNSFAGAYNQNVPMNFPPNMAQQYDAQSGQMAGGQTPIYSNMTPQQQYFVDPSSMPPQFGPIIGAQSSSPVRKANRPKKTAKQGSFIGIPGTLPPGYPNVALQQQQLDQSNNQQLMQGYTQNLAGTNPFVDNYGTMHSAPMHPGVNNQQQQLEQCEWQPTPFYSTYNTSAALNSPQQPLTGQQIDSLYDAGTPSTEFLGSASFNHNARREKPQNTVADWSSPSNYNYDLIMRQQMADGFNYGDYDGEITLDFEFARPLDIDEEERKEDENTEEENSKKEEKEEEEKVGKTESSDRQSDKVENSEARKETKTVQMKKMVNKLTKQQTEKEEKLIQYLYEVRQCDPQKLEECWMKLFDALTALDDEDRYDNMRRYCSANKSWIRYCSNMAMCDDIDKVIVFKKKTEEDEVIIEEDEEEKEDDNEKEKAQMNEREEAKGKEKKTKQGKSSDKKPIQNEVSSEKIDKPKKSSTKPPAAAGVKKKPNKEVAPTNLMDEPYVGQPQALQYSVSNIGYGNQIQQPYTTQQSDSLMYATGPSMLPHSMSSIGPSMTLSDSVYTTNITPYQTVPNVQQQNQHQIQYPPTQPYSMSFNGVPSQQYQTYTSFSMPPNSGQYRDIVLPQSHLAPTAGGSGSLAPLNQNPSQPGMAGSPSFVGSDANAMVNNNYPSSSDNHKQRSRRPKRGDHQSPYDFSKYNNSAKSASTQSSSSSRRQKTGIPKIGQKANVEKKIETPEEHMSNHLKMYMQCVKKLLTEHLLVDNRNEDKVSKNFRQILYGVMLPKPVFIAQQLNMTLNGMPKDGIDIASLMSAPSYSMANPFVAAKKFIKDKGLSEKSTKNNEMETKPPKKGMLAHPPIKQDLRVLLEIASTQSRDQLEQIRKISDSFGYITFTDAAKIFITKQSDSVDAKDSIIQFLNWRLMGHSEEIEKSDNDKINTINSRKRDAKTVFIAIKNLNNNNLEQLIEILVERSNAELLAIQNAFVALYGETMKKCIRKKMHINGDFYMLLLDLIDANRDEVFCNDKEMAIETAVTLYEAGVKRAGTHEGKFIRIFANTNKYQLNLVEREYDCLPIDKKHSLRDAIKSEFSGEMEISLLKILEIAKRERKNTSTSALDEAAKANYKKKLCPNYYYQREYENVKQKADQIYAGVHGLGANPAAIIKILVEQSNAEMLAIMRCYNELYGHRSQKKQKPMSLRDRLKDELHGDVERLALDLLEGNRNERTDFVPNCERAEEQAAELHNPGEGPLGKLRKATARVLLGQENTSLSVKYFIEFLANEHFRQLRLMFEMYKRNSNKKNGGKSAIEIFKSAIEKLSGSINESNNVMKNNAFFKIATNVIDKSKTNDAFKIGLQQIVDIAVKKVSDDELKTMMEKCEKLNSEEMVENLSSQYFVTAAEKDATVLRKAMKGWGTNEKALIWILTTRKNNREIWSVYKTMYGNDLLARLKDETDGFGEKDFQYALEKLLGSQREDSTTFKPDKIKAKKQAVELFEASSNVAPRKFIDMLATVHLNQLLLVFDEYEKLYKIMNKKKLAPSDNYTFEELLKKKQSFSGDFLRTLLAIVSLARKGIDEAEKALADDAAKKNRLKKFWYYLVELYKGFKPVTTLELAEFKKFVKLCDQQDITDGQACAATISPEEKSRLRELHEEYFTKQITRSLKDMLGIFKMPSTKHKAKIDLHRLIISRYQYDLGDIMRSIDRLSLKQIVDRFESWRFTFDGLMKDGKLIETQDKLYAHALKRLLNIENAKQITGYDDFLENYGTNLLDFMQKIDNDQYAFGVEMKAPKKGEDKRVSVNVHLYALPKPTNGEEIQNPYKEVKAEVLRKKQNLQKYLSESMFLHDLIQAMCQDLIDRLDLMYRARFKKKILNKSDVKKFDQNIVGGPQFRDQLNDEWKKGEQQQQRHRQNANGEDEDIKPEWTFWGETIEEDMRRKVTVALYEDHVKVFKLLFWARFYALAIALQRIPVEVKEDAVPQKITKEEGAKLFGYNDYADVKKEEENANATTKELAATFRIDVPRNAWPDETRRQTEELRKKFEQDMDILEEYILANFNHQMLYNGQSRFYQVGYETLQKLGYDDVLQGAKLRTLLVHEMEEMLEEADTGVNKESDEDYSLKTVHFTKANVQLFKKGNNGTEKLKGIEKWLQKVFNWLDGLVDKCHKKSLTKRNRMQRFLFDKIKTLLEQLRGLFTGQTPPIKFVMKKFMPMLYYGSKYGMKFLKWIGRLFKPMLSIFKSSKEKTGYKHKKHRLESKKAMFGLLMEVDSAVEDNKNIREKWRRKGDQIWEENRENEMEKIWAEQIEAVKMDETNELSKDAFKQVTSMLKEGTDMPKWMINTPKDSKSSSNKNAGTSSKAVSSNTRRRGKRRVIRNATKPADKTEIRSTFTKETLVRKKRRGGFGGGHAASHAMSRSFSHAHYSAAYYPHGGSYCMGYHYHSSTYYYYTPYHVSHKEVLAEIWTFVNILLIFIIPPISFAFCELDCSISSSSSHSSHSYGGHYSYDYTAAQKLREREEKQRKKRAEKEATRRRQKEKEDELDYEIAQWDEEIKFGSKSNRRTKRGALSADSNGMMNNGNENPVEWYQEEAFGISKNSGFNRRQKRSAQDCGAYIGITIFLLWIIIWIGGYFFIAFGPI